MINVIDSKGHEQPLDLSKITLAVNEAVEGLDGVDADAIISKANLRFYNGMRTADIQQILVDTAEQMIQIDTPNYAYIAARLYLRKMRKEVKANGIYTFQDYIDRAVSINRMDRNFLTKYTQEQIDDLVNYIDYDRDKLFKYIGIKYARLSYLLHDEDNRLIELPQWWFMTIAMFLAQAEKDNVKWAKKFYDVMSQFLVFPGTPTLSNARTRHSQLSSCYVGSTPDNAEGIMLANKNMAILSKYGGGIGWDWTTVRGSLGYINGHKGAAGGPLPMLKISNAVSNAFDQLGCVAKNSYVKVKRDDDKIETILISDVEVGDLIKSYNIKTNTIEFKRVLETHKMQVAKENQIKIEYAHGYIVTSNWHPTPILRDGRYQYIRADEVKISDIGVDENGLPSEVIQISNPNISEEYRDLSVEDNENYFCSTDIQDNRFYLIHNTRKGAISPYIEPWHKDIKDFIEIQKPHGEKRLRSEDLHPGLWFNEIFFKRVEEDSTWTLFDPIDVPKLTESYGEEFNRYYMEYENDDSIPKEVISAKSLWRLYISTYYEFGKPYFTIKDAHNAKNPNSHNGIIRSSNLCTEISQNTDPGKLIVRVTYDNEVTETYLATDELELEIGGTVIAEKIMTTDIIKDKGRAVFIEKDIIDAKIAVCNLASINMSRVYTKEDLHRVVPIAVRMLDNVIDLNFYPVKAARDTNLENRAIGLGLMGGHEFAVARGFQFGSQEHKEAVDEFMENFTLSAIEASSDLGEEKGDYPGFEGSKWNKGILPVDIPNELVDSLTTRKWDIDRLEIVRDKASKHMRNGYLLAVAPTSTISIIAGTTKSVEPVYKPVYYERENSKGSHIWIAPNLNPDTYGLYKTMFDHDQYRLVEIMAIMQKNMDQTISYNLGIAQGATGKTISDLLLYIARLKNRSTYYLKTVSPEEKKSTTGDHVVECVGCQ